MEKKKEGQHQKVTKEPDTMSDKPGFKGIVRIAGKDVAGAVPFGRALLVVRGIGPTLSIAISNIIKSELGISHDKPVGELTDEEIEKVDKILFNIYSYKIPKFLFNRNKDATDGETRHYIMNDLMFYSKQDVEKEKKLYTWKGYRHAYGQKVRGQRTRNTGRTGMAVGVLRKSIIAAQKEAVGAGKPGAPGAPGAAAPAASAAPAKGGAATPAAKPAEKVAAKPAAKPAEKK